MRGKGAIRDGADTHVSWWSSYRTSPSPAPLANSPEPLEDELQLRPDPILRMKAPPRALKNRSAMTHAASGKLSAVIQKEMAGLTEEDEHLLQLRERFRLLADLTCVWKAKVAG